MNLDREIIKQIIEVCKKHEYVDKVILFGSRARSDNGLKSDIDLAIYSELPLAQFIEDVELNTKTLLEFDFSHMNIVKDDFFIQQVEKEGIVIYEKYGI